MAYINKSNPDLLAVRRICELTYQQIEQLSADQNIVWESNCCYVGNYVGTYSSCRCQSTDWIIVYWSTDSCFIRGLFPNP